MKAEPKEAGLYNPRLESILSLISRKRTVSVTELRERLGVSGVTVRKYLDILEGEGIIVRTHGGAMMAEDRSSIRTISMREETRVEEKREIARAAKALVSEGDVIFLDSGTSCRALARELSGMSLQVITTSLDVMEELAPSPSISLFCPGGSLRREARAFIGPTAVEALRDLRIGTCFLGASGFSAEASFYTQNLVESQLKRQVLGVSRRRVVLADSAKLGLEAFSVFARPGSLDLLVTDSGFPLAEEFRALGIEVITARSGQD
ncbi:MAG TPA: DeoR/GlpR family DNA-binding transcription regulator [Rectinemataceae bacterium]|nr:DeoR/GlpR family DNA-binding transcription regulator [Rectinemataceae bacterium]